MHPRNSGFIDRNNPMGGMMIILVVMLAFQVLGRPISRSPEDIAAYLISFIVAITIHEFAHAWVALKLGDDTAQRLGRITLNPISHFDPFGFFGMVMISLGFPFIGWGKPVPVNPGRFTVKRFPRQRGMAIVALAGPVSNVLQALLVTIPLRLTNQRLDIADGLERFLAIFVLVNILLASFNMIPIPPLDGSKILLGLVPSFWYPVIAPLERYGFIVLIALFFIGGQIGREIVGGMIDPVREFLTRVVVGPSPLW
jgi:Zn-dependent protease